MKITVIFSEQATREDKKIKKLLSDTNPFVLLCHNTTQHSNTTQAKAKAKQKGSTRIIIFANLPITYKFNNTLAYARYHHIISHGQ